MASLMFVSVRRPRPTRPRKAVLNRPVSLSNIALAIPLLQRRQDATTPAPSAAVQTIVSAAWPVRVRYCRCRASA